MDSLLNGSSAASPYDQGLQVVDGVDIWMHGAPDREFDVIKQSTVTNWLPLPGTHGTASRIVDAVRDAGGDAAIVYNTHTYRESTNTHRHMYVSTIERTEIAIVRYR